MVISPGHAQDPRAVAARGSCVCVLCCVGGGAYADAPRASRCLITPATASATVSPPV